MTPVTERTPQAPGRRLGNPPRDLTAGDLLALVWRRRRQFLLAMLVGFVVGVGLSKLRHKKYTTRATFVSVGGTRLSLPGNLGALGALASQFGVNFSAVGGVDAQTMSPYFYVDLLTADTILRQLANVRLRDSTDTNRLLPPLRVLLKVSGRSQADSLQRAARRLRGMLVVDLVPRTGMVKVMLTAYSPYIAAAAADTLLGLVNGFVGRDLRTRAGATRRFLQDRAVQAQDELHAEQERLRAFLEANREYQNSPMLQFRQAELQRDVDLKRDIYLSVARSLEEARMNEARDTPLISIIDRPAIPTRPSGPRALVNALLLAIFMPFLWLAVVLIRQITLYASRAEDDRM